MNFYAHSIPDASEEQWQTLEEHSNHVADLVAKFSASFCDPTYARNLGLLHDVGKYQEEFQYRIRGNDINVEHAICGAQLWMERGEYEAGAYCIAGHHGGLPDGGSIVDKESTLLGRLKGKTGDFSSYEQELSLHPPCESPCESAVDFNGDLSEKEYAFWTRMMFSCLTDGDYLDTERVYAPDISRGISANFPTCLEKIQNKLDGFSPTTPVNIARHALRMQMLEHIHTDGEIFLLNLPTGAGKTLASMEFALHRAIQQEKKRIIYIIPYTSIIEQNAAVFRQELGDCILEHHCNFDYEKVVSDTVRAKLQNAAENWDADIIVTTNVQFFQSIYGNRGRNLRKLHNIANSVLIFDEVHMLPSDFYAPCLEAVKILTTRYGCEGLFMTATMPDFHRWFDEFGLKNVKMVDLISDTKPFEAFHRCRIENLGSISFDALLQHLPSDKSTLLVVNKRKTAKEIFQKLQSRAFHLSTCMNHADRTRVIGEIRQALGKEPITVVSTSLIEAGVDLDFDQVYREMAGLDNLLQTAGRCNREGRKSGCVTYNFSFVEEDFQVRHADSLLKQNCLQEIFEQFESVTSSDAIATYFNRFYQATKINMEKHDIKHAIKWTLSPVYGEFLSMAFRTYAEEFQLISEDGRTVVILCEESKLLLDQLSPENSRIIKRKLQPYGVALRQYEYQSLCDQGVIAEKMGVAYLSNGNYYSHTTGITFEDDTIYVI